MTNEGTEDVGGTETVHIAADADVEQMLTDIGTLASSVPGADSQGFDPTQLSAISSAVTEASIDVYSGADDHVLRKLDVEPDDRPVGGRAGGHGGPDREHPGLVRGSRSAASTRSRRSRRRPTRSRSTELFGDLGLDSSALGGLDGALPGGTGSGSGDADAFQQCMQQATTPEEINACAAELQG